MSLCDSLKLPRDVGGRGLPESSEEPVAHRRGAGRADLRVGGPRSRPRRRDDAVLSCPSTRKGRHDKGRSQDSWRRSVLQRRRAGPAWSGTPSLDVRILGRAHRNPAHRSLRPHGGACDNSFLRVVPPRLAPQPCAHPGRNPRSLVVSGRKPGAAAVDPCLDLIGQRVRHAARSRHACPPSARMARAPGAALSQHLPVQSPCPGPRPI